MRWLKPWLHKRLILPPLLVAVCALFLGACAPEPVAPNGATPSVALAVLPFTMPAVSPDTNWFSDGVSRELIDALGRNAGLRVTAWQSTRRFHASTRHTAAIGEELHVAALLRGTLLAQGDQTVVFTELIDALSGRTIWSQSYSGSLTSLLATEAHIARDVGVALHAGAGPTYATPKVDPKAHELVLRARALLWSAHDASEVATARLAAGKAAALDSGYSEAHAVLAQAWMNIVLNMPSTLQQASALPKARAEAEQALALDPDNIDALYALGNVDFNSNEPAQARTEYARVVALDPSEAQAHMALGDLMPDLPSMRNEFAIATQLDPFDATAQNNLADACLDLGQYQQALSAAAAYSGLQPRNVDAAYLLALTDTLQHRDQDAVNAFDIPPPPSLPARQLDDAGRLAYRSRLDPALRGRAEAAVSALQRWSSISPTFTADLLQAELVLGEDQAALVQLPSLCAASPVACSDLGRFPLWLPLHGKRRFEVLVKKYDTISQPLASAPTSR
ncbi:MAG: tetratricopeptide repeat protein [Rhodanobacteraceae bacterium]